MSQEVWDSTYIEETAQKSIGATIPALQQWTDDCRRAFINSGFPKPRDEHWKYTNISEIEKQHYVVDQRYNEPNIDKFSIADTLQLVFVNGQFSDTLSDDSLPKGLVVKSLSNALKENTAGCVEVLKDRKNLDNSFANLNASLMTSGMLLYAEKNAVIKKPIHLLFINNDSDAVVMHHPRHVLIADKHAELCVIEDYVGYDNACYFNNVVTQVIARENSAFYYYKCQRESQSAQHIANIQIQQCASSRVLSRQVFMGGSLSRENLNFNLNEDGAECELLGLYLLNDKQHIDNHSVIMHKASHCQSSQNYKGIVANQGHSVFNGKVVVEKDVLQTVAHQSNKNLLLDRHSVADTKPELEIYADDVKCSHGATVGQLDCESLFYLQSRGIPYDLARYLLTRAFATELLEKIPCEIMRPFLLEQVEQKLSGLYPQGDF